MCMFAMRKGGRVGVLVVCSYVPVWVCVYVCVLMCFGCMCVFRECNSCVSMLLWLHVIAVLSTYMLSHG